MRHFLTAAAVLLAIAAAALADDCPNGQCPANQPPASMYTVAGAPGTTSQATPHAVRVDVLRSRPALFPRLAMRVMMLRDRHPVRRLAARLLWKC